jgi:hypothetical protein
MGIIYTNVSYKPKRKSKKVVSVAPSFKEIITCPYCLKQGQYASMKRWHFEHCKQRGNLL